MRSPFRAQPRVTANFADAAFEDLARSARLLLVRSLREATGLFAGNYVSAFRGGGIEFEESRPYAAGDDIRSIDWNATARSGIPFVKRFREERNQTLLFALDTSASMRFGTTARTKSATAAHAVALLAAAAARAGDRSGLIAFDGGARRKVPIGRGIGHTWLLIRTAVEVAAASRGTTQLRASLRGLQAHTRQRCTLVVVSDFRDRELLPPDGSAGTLHAALAGLTRRHDVVAAVVVDPRERDLPAAGPIRVADPERPGSTFVLDTGSRRARAKYRAASAAWCGGLERELRRCGADLLWLFTDRNPLYSLGPFFHERAVRRFRVAK